jgi:hypothetical protein
MSKESLNVFFDELEKRIGNMDFSKAVRGSTGPVISNGPKGSTGLQEAKGPKMVMMNINGRMIPQIP